MGYAADIAAVDCAARTLLGGAVRYSPGLGDPVDIRGIFDAHTALGTTAAGVLSYGPAVWVRLEDLSSDPRTDKSALITIDDLTWSVRDTRLDGQGGALLLLGKAAA